MNDLSLDQNLDIKEQDNNSKKYFSNVFSKMNKSERDKKYQILQKNLYLLSKDLKLLKDYANKDNFGSKKKSRYGRYFVKNENRFKMLRNGNNALLYKKMKMRYSLPLNIINTNLNQNDNSINNSFNKKNIKEKKYNKSSNDRLIYKTEVNKSPILINGKQLPKININSDIGSETKIDSSINNINISNSSRLPSLQIKDSKRLYFFTDNDNNIKPKTIINKKILSKHFHLPKKKINLDNNLFIQQFPSIIDSQRLKSSINRSEFEHSTDKMMKKMQEKNIKIKRKINYKLSEQDLIDWEMKSKIKLSQWKFGIAEIEKYFVDLKAYGKPEEEELLKRKTFYDEVEDVIDEIKQTKEERELNKIKKNYYKEKKNLNQFEKEEKDNEKNNDINMVENTLNKHVEISDALKKIKKRKMNEQKKRHIINNILVQSELRRKNINRSTDKLYEKINENDEKYNAITERKESYEKLNKRKRIFINK